MIQWSSLLLCICETSDRFFKQHSLEKTFYKTCGDGILLPIFKASCCQSWALDWAPMNAPLYGWHIQAAQQTHPKLPLRTVLLLVLMLFSWCSDLESACRCRLWGPAPPCQLPHLECLRFGKRSGGWLSFPASLDTEQGVWGPETSKALAKRSLFFSC